MPEPQTPAEDAAVRALHGTLPFVEMRRADFVAGAAWERERWIEAWKRFASLEDYLTWPDEYEFDQAWAALEALAGSGDGE